MVKFFGARFRVYSGPPLDSWLKKLNFDSDNLHYNLNHLLKNYSIFDIES